MLVVLVVGTPKRTAVVAVVERNRAVQAQAAGWAGRVRLKEKITAAVRRRSRRKRKRNCWQVEQRRSRRYFKLNKRGDKDEEC
jgi:hypothetical protein